MHDAFIVFGLALITLAIVVTYLVIDRIGLEKAKSEHHHSAVTERKPEQRDG